MAEETENEDIFDLDGAMDDVGMTDQDVDIQSLADDPNTFLTDSDLNLTDNYTELDATTEGTELDASDSRYDLGDDLVIDNTNTVADEDVTLADDITDPPDSVGYSDNVETVEGSLGTPETTVNAAQGTVSDDAQVDSDEIEIDMEGVATGINEDGTVNRTGEALNEYASQDFSTIIDTSTSAGRLLADELGEGNYTDAKATISGQLEILSRQFKDPDTGEPVIPLWAQGTARALRRTIAFDGITGTAATAAMANAIMESTISISKDEAKFFQTLTTKNLDNRQKAIINKANALSKFEEANLGAREAAAVQNAKAFLQMDLLNVKNEQEAEVINTQERIDVMLSDAAETNVARRFDAEQENDFAKFYDELSASIQKHRSEQMNSVAKFNAGELNDGAEFSAEMEDSRQRFYSEMQYQIDLDNAKWRQDVATTNTEMEFEAAAEDVRNGLDLSQEAMNQMWDRVDSLLDFSYKSYNDEADRDTLILTETIAAQSRANANTSNPVLDGLIAIAASRVAGGSDIDVIGGVESGLNWLTGGSAGASNTNAGSFDFSSLGSTLTSFGLTGGTGFISGTASAIAAFATSPIGILLGGAAGLRALGVDIDLMDVDLTDIDINPFDEGELEIDLIGSVEDVVNRDWLDWGW